MKKLKKKLWHDRQICAFASLAIEARTYLDGMLKANVPIKKNITKILALKDEYGSAAIIAVIQKALRFDAYGADYIENILHQKMTPQKHHPPVKLKKDDLNRIVLSQPCLADYDAQVVETASQKNWSAIRTFTDLFDLELEYRRQNRIALCFRKSKLTEKLTIDQFDFNYHRSRKK